MTSVWMVSILDHPYCNSFATNRPATLRLIKNNTGTQIYTWNLKLGLDLDLQFIELKIQFYVIWPYNLYVSCGPRSPWITHVCRASMQDQYLALELHHWRPRSAVIAQMSYGRVEPTPLFRVDYLIEEGLKQGVICLVIWRCLAQSFTCVFFF